MDTFLCEMQTLHPSLVESPTVLYPGHPLSVLKNVINSRNGAKEVTMDKSPPQSLPASFLSFSFLSDRPQLIQYQGVLFKFQVIFPTETPPQISKDVESELWQVLQATLHCILRELDPPDLIRTESLCIRPQLKFWPLSQQLFFLQEGEGVTPCDRMIELYITECFPPMPSAPAPAPAAAAAKSGNEFCEDDFSVPDNMDSFPPQQHKKSSARVRFRGYSSSESIELKEKKNNKLRKKMKKKYLSETQHKSGVDRTSSKEHIKRLFPGEMDGDGSDTEAEESPLRGITDKFSKLTFFSPGVKRLRKRKASSNSPTQTWGCRSPRPKIPRSVCMTTNVSPVCAVPQAGKACELLQCCHSDCALPQSKQHLKVRDATAEAWIEEASTQDSLQSSSFGEYVTDASVETEDDIMKYSMRSSLRMCGSGLNTKAKKKSAPVWNLSQAQAAGGGDVSCGQKREKLLDWLLGDSSSPLCSQEHEHPGAGSQEVPTACGDHHGSYTSCRESALRKWLADTTDWNSKSRPSQENNPDQCVFYDSDAPDVEVCTPLLLTDGSSQADSSQHHLNVGQLSRHEVRDEASSTFEVCCPSPIKKIDGATPMQHEGKGVKHVMSSPEEMTVKRFCRHIPARDNSLMQNNTKADQAESSWHEVGSKSLEPRVSKSGKSLTSSEKSLASASSKSRATTEEMSLSQVSRPLSGSAESEYALCSSSSGNPYMSPTTTNTSPDSASQKHNTRRSTRSKENSFKPKYLGRSPKTQALDGGTKRKTIPKTSNAPFWAKSNISKSKRKGLEYVQTQIKLFVKKGPPEIGKQTGMRNEVQFEAQGETPFPADVQTLPEIETTAARPKRKKKLYTGNVLLAGDGSKKETLGKTLEYCTNDRPMPQFHFSTTCRPVESNNKVSHKTPPGHPSSTLCLDSNSGIYNGNNCSSDSQDMLFGAGDNGLILERSNRQLEESMDV